MKVAVMKKPVVGNNNHKMGSTVLSTINCMARTSGFTGRGSPPTKTTLKHIHQQSEKVEGCKKGLGQFFQSTFYAVGGIHTLLRQWTSVWINLHQHSSTSSVQTKLQPFLSLGFVCMCYLPSGKSFSGVRSNSPNTQTKQALTLVELLQNSTTFPQRRVLEHFLDMGPISLPQPNDLTFSPPPTSPQACCPKPKPLDWSNLVPLPLCYTTLHQQWNHSR